MTLRRSLLRVSAARPPFDLDRFRSAGHQIETSALRASLTGASVVVDPDATLKEITGRNNRVGL